MQFATAEQFEFFGESDPATEPQSKVDWSAASIATRKTGAQLETGVRFANNVTGESFTESFLTDPDDLDGLKRLVDERLSKLAAVTGRITPGIDLTPVETAPVGPTPEEQAQTDYFAARRKVARLQELVKLGRKDVTQQMVDDAVAEWNAQPFLPQYEGL